MKYDEQPFPESESESIGRIGWEVDSDLEQAVVSETFDEGRTDLHCGFRSRALLFLLARLLASA